MTTLSIINNVPSVAQDIGASPIFYSFETRAGGRKNARAKLVSVGGVDYVPYDAVAEALDIIAGYSELYDGLASSPSEPTAHEKKAEGVLSRRWAKLLIRVYPGRKAVNSPASSEMPSR